MEGHEANTMDGDTRIKLVLGSSEDGLRSRSRRASAGVGEQDDSLRARLIAASVETIAAGSGPRLVGTRHSS